MLQVATTNTKVGENIQEIGLSLPVLKQADSTSL